MSSYLLKIKLGAFFINLKISLILSALSGALIFLLWYRHPYEIISGGRELFFLIFFVDIAIGPIITFIVFNPQKSRREKIFEFSIIILLQIFAFIYGLYIAAQARPVKLAFEYDRLRVVSASEISKEFVSTAYPALNKISWTGPDLISLRSLTSNEKIDRTMLALGGVPLSIQADLWQPYENAHTDILKASRPASELKLRFPSKNIEIENILKSTKIPISSLIYLPLVSRSDIVFTAILDRETLKLINCLPLDSF
ncbi:MAG: pilus assembly protein [Delftia acidovorans]|nr:pilus assembly protein [Delftia acidovorans]